MKAQDLKNSILQLAIQGRLVVQDSNDEPAEVLYAKIQAEKQKLIKEGKIKKDKPLPPITDDEIPFEIPSTWKWVRLGDCYDVRDGTHDTPKYVSTGVPLVTSKNLSNGILDLSNVKFISLEDAKKIDERSKVDRNDILFAMIGTIGNPVIVDVEPNFCIKNMALIKYNKFMDTNYILYLLIKAQDDMKKEAQGAVQSFVSLSFIRNFPIPLPPLAEQKRIVAKIEELEPLVKQYDKAETELSALNDSFPEQLKKSILQYAIQGKLVVQDSNDEPAEALYAKIQAEKQRLIKEGKIKKDKPLPSITDDEIPFEIPSTWKWVRLGSISNYSSAKKKILPNQIDPETWSLDLEDIEKGTGRVLKKCFAKDRIIRGEKVCFTKGNILYSKLRPYLLKILIADDDGITTPELVPFNFYGDSYQQFFLWYLKSPYVDSIVNSESYGVKMPRVGTDTMVQLLVPLPPLAEQKRIVAKVNDLMQYCEKLKS